MVAMSHFNISGTNGGNNQFGDNTIQNNILQKNMSEQVLNDIEQSNLTEQEKQEAKSLVDRLLNSPVLGYVLNFLKKHFTE